MRAARDDGSIVQFSGRLPAAGFDGLVVCMVALTCPSSAPLCELVGSRLSCQSTRMATPSLSGRGARFAQWADFHAADADAPMRYYYYARPP